MNREIMKIVNRVVSEEVSDRISNIKYRLFENKGSEMCESCGSEMNEGEMCESCGNTNEGSEMCESCGSGDMYEGECMECGNMYEGNIQELGGMDDGHPRFGKKRLPNKMSIEDIENLLRGDNDMDTRTPEEREMDRRDIDMDTRTPEEREMDRRDIGMVDEDIYEIELGVRFNDNRKEIDKAKPYGKITPKDFKALRSMKKEVEEMVYELDLEEDDVEEGNAFTGALSNAKKHHKDEFEVNGKKYNVKESKVYFTESEIIDIIENIVKEEKKKGKAPSAQNILKSTLGQSKKENEENIKRVAKKMKEYLKDGSKGKYDPNPKYFPKGNGEIEKMEKMAFSLTDDNEDFNYEIAGLNIPVPDAIEFNDERMDKYYEGSSETGNAPGGNAIESEANSRFNKMRKKQTLHRLKQQSYNKSPQPVFNEKSGQEKGKGINIKLESTEDKKVISEMEKIKNLIGYNRKTQ